jgi:ribosomal protein RSM22 (predicted rRNA methylase)
MKLDDSRVHMRLTVTNNRLDLNLNSRTRRVVKTTGERARASSQAARKAGHSTSQRRSGDGRPWNMSVARSKDDEQTVLSARSSERVSCPSPK